jgi:hypothetical protein
MSFVVSSLTNYNNEQNKELLSAALFGSTTATYAQRRAGIKSSEALQLFDEDIFLQSGSSCGHAPTGNTTFSQRNITVGKAKVDKEWCLSDLETKWTQMLLPSGSNYTEADLPRATVEQVMANLMQIIETADWQGNTSSGNPNLNRYDGIQKILSDAGTTINANVSAYIATPITAWTSSNVIGAIDGMILAMVTNKPGVMAKAGRKLIFVPREVFTLYNIANRTANYFGFDGTAGQNPNEVRVLGYSDVYVVAADGLNGTKDAYMLHEGNLFLGEDNVSDMDNADLWFSQDDRTVKLQIKFKRGWQVAFPDEVVNIILA